MANQTTPPTTKPKGKFRRAMSWSFSSFFNVFGWLGLSSLTKSAEDIKAMGSDFLSVQHHEAHEETFEQAAKRLGLNKKALLKEEKIFLRLSMIFLCIAVLILFYALYLAWMGWFLSFILAIIITGVALAYAFRFHFWWFQVKHHKLGCTFEEWYNSKILPTKTKGEKL